MKGWISLCLLMVVTTGAEAQTVQKLRDRREALLREIRQTGQALEEKRTHERQALESLLLLERQLALRQEAVRQIRRDRDALVHIIQQLEKEATVAGEGRDKALQAYRRLARYRLYHRLSSKETLLYFLAAPQLGIGMQRALVYDRIAMRRREAARRYRDEQDRLLRIKEEKVTAREEQDRLLSEEKHQESRISLERTERSNLIRSLQKQMRTLEADLSRQEKERARLEDAIASAVRKEIEAEEARKKKPATTPKAKPGKADPATTPAGEAIAGDFRRNKGKLPWPVEKALLVRPFGEQRHPDLPQVRINNTGIDLRTTADAPVKAVFEGTVSGVQYVPGFAYTVILRHGSYYTVYSNMESVTVKKGDTVKAGSQVGKAARSGQATYSDVHFEVWNGKNRQDPAHWLMPQR